MKEKILKKLTRLSRKYRILRLPILVVIFLFLGICHIFRYIYNQKWRLCGTFCAFLVFLLSSSFALPVLLDINCEEGIQVVYESDLNEMMQNGELEAMTAEEEALLDEDFHDYESYDVNEVDTYSMDEILQANEDYLNMQMQENEAGVSDEQQTGFAADDWRLVLINKQHPIPDDYSFTLATIAGSMQCDERILGDLLSMLQAAKEDQVSLIICSPYRDLSKQVYLFERKIKAYMNRGLTYMDAYKVASQAVTVPGASEHQIGLSLDIYSADYTVLDEGFGNTKAGKWLAQHSWEYGFVLRYPKDKEYITGIEYEPWHFRYVGKEAAAVMKSEQITLEEFWNLYVD